MRFRQGVQFLFPVAAAVGLFALLVGNRNPPPRTSLEEVPRPAMVVEVRPVQVIPRATGYGYVQPAETWRAIAEVGGRVIELHPELQRGAFITKGELLVRLDPVSYGLAEQRGEASVASIDAQLLELDQQKQNTERLLKIEEDALRLIRQELARKKDLHRQGFLSASELEQEERNLLAQQTKVNNLQNTLDLLPAQKSALLAKKSSDMSSLSEQRLNVGKTVLRAPFDCRIAEVDVELEQFAPAGQTLLSAISIDAVEIPVQLALGEFANLLPPSLGERSPLLHSGLDMEAIREMIGLRATVRLPLFSREASWEATFARTSESIDLRTGAMTVYVAVSEPYAKARPSVRPPLVPNLYTEVELRGRPRDDRLVVPVRALHGKSLHLVDDQRRLAKKEVEVEMVAGDFAVIGEGLAEGDLVVVTDLVPAIEGMLLEPLPDRQTMAAIALLGVPATAEAPR